MRRLHQVFPLFGHVITPGVLTALHSVLKYQAGLWFYLEALERSPTHFCVAESWPRE